ncbi:uncharacterized protein LOC112521941 [Cynara cardunculus var. scolymus]|uniref:Hepatoma-derived growth factor-related protein 2-like n=1 Tax=Cynara cardunculus var. scolymus TaxID=59895 RepID=A0A124SB87_CYNCS|nr:uncharacterized protein LOC112521941 [Cynara cardunculus var. scolymus]KVH89857.1 hypothetical protein Ccrd_008149 [Cynara cardunculus var. scolymus]
MADHFSFLTDSDDDRAVEDVLEQAMDHSVLEQLAAINCSSFSTTDNLPSHLETRFRKLKSLPTTTASPAASRFPPSKSRSLRPRSRNDVDLDERHPGFCGSADFERIPDGKKGLESPPSNDSPEEQSDGNRCERKGLESKSKSNLKSDTSPRAEVYKQKDLKAKSGTGSSKSQSDSWSLSSPESDTGTLSPPRRKIGCLWCSPKKEKSVPRKQGKENRQSSSSSWGNDADFLKAFSIKEQKKMMKKAMKEEEKINREAEKIVKWAKQASARMMDVSGVDDELSDIENTK